MNKKMLSINLISSLIAFLVSTGVGLVLSPFIIENLGSESYAFVKLANDFIAYISLISIAINSMASRFISVSYMKGDKNEARGYYSSVYYADIILSVVIFLIGIIAIFFLDKLIEIPNILINEVKLVFLIVLINFVFTMYFTVYSVGVFIKNKLYLSSIRNIEAGLFRVLFLFCLFYFLEPRIYYIPFTTLIITLYMGFFNRHYTKKLTPDLVINRKNYDFKKIKEILSSGIWNTISQLSFILNEGLDLLVSNIFIGSYQMGLLAVAKTLPNMVTQVYSHISSVFMPDFTNLYANQKYDQMKKEIDFSIKILSVIVTIPVAGLIAFGREFYSLWVPTQDIQTIHVLSILTVLCIIISGSTVSIHNVFTVANKVKINSIVTLIVGGVNIILVLLLLNTTNLGVFAVAGVSSVTSIIRNLVFTFPYAAKCIKCKWTSFYFPAFRGAFCCIVVCIINTVVKQFISADNWISFFAAVALGSSIGLVFNFIIIIRKFERQLIFNKLKDILSIKRRKV